MTHVTRIAIDPAGRGRPASAVPAALACVLALLSVAGCGDPKAASKENFKKALSAFFGKGCAMLTPAAMSQFGGSTQPFPVKVTIAPVTDADAPRYEALAKAGLLTQGPVTTSMGMFNQMTKTVPFDLTDKGKAMWRAPNSVAPGSPGGFCGGQVHVVSVDRFSEPVAAGGQQVSQVTFTMRDTYDDWTKAPFIQKAFPTELSHAGPVSLSLPMVLMNDGWALPPNLPASGL